VSGDGSNEQSPSELTSLPTSTSTSKMDDQNALLAWAASVSSADVSGGELSVRVFTEAGTVRIER
jgi:hypothetical protein